MIDKVPISKNQEADEANSREFTAGVHWKVLNLEDEVIEDPNHYKNYHTPTAGKEEVMFVKKRNCAQVLD